MQRDGPHVDERSDRDEENQDEKLAERCDYRLDHSASGGFGDHRAGDEGSELKRESGDVPEPRGGEGDGRAKRDHRPGRRAAQKCNHDPPQERSADDEGDDHEERRLQQREHDAGGRQFRRGADRYDEDQHGDEILCDQQRDRGVSWPLVEQPENLEQRDTDRGARKSERQTERDRVNEAEEPSEARGGHAEQEHQHDVSDHRNWADRAEFADREIQTQAEEQQDQPQLAQAPERSRARRIAEGKWPDRDPRNHVSENRRDAEPARQSAENARSDERGRQVGKESGRRLLRHDRR